MTRTPDRAPDHEMDVPAPSAPLPALPRTWYPPVSRAVTRIMAAAIVAGMVALALALPQDGGWGTGSRIGVVITGVLGAAGVLVAGRPHVRADEDGLTVVNLLRTHRLAWAQIVRVQFGPGDPWVHLDLSDGETLPVMGVQTSNGRDRAIAAARELRDLVDRFSHR